MLFCHHLSVQRYGSGPTFCHPNCQQSYLGPVTSSQIVQSSHKDLRRKLSADNTSSQREQNPYKDVRRKPNKENRSINTHTRTLPVSQV